MNVGIGKKPHIWLAMQAHPRKPVIYFETIGEVPRWFCEWERDDNSNNRLGYGDTPLSAYNHWRYGWTFTGP
jgi:hypothetical protein